MANPLRSATVYSTIAAIEATRGPDLEQFRIPLDRPYLYRWVIGNTDVRDGTSTLTHTGGVIGRWKEVAPVGGVSTDRGATLTDADQTLTWTASTSWQELPAATLTANRTKTLSTTGATAGAIKVLTRRDVTAFTMAVVNGGAGGGTLTTFPASTEYYGVFYYDGTNWLLRFAGPMVVATAVPPPEAFTPRITLDRDTTQTFAGSGATGIAIAAGATHVEGVTKTVLFPAGTATALELGDDLNVDGQDFSAAADMSVVITRLASRFIASRRNLGLRDLAAPTVVSASVDLSNANALVVVFSKKVYVQDLTGLSLAFTSGTARTLTAVEAGNWTTTVTFTLSGDVASGNVFSFVRAAVVTLQDLNGNFIAAGSTAVSVSDSNNLNAVPNLIAWLRADLGVTTVSGAVSAWADQSTAGLGSVSQATAAQRPTYDTSVPALPGVLFNNVGGAGAAQWLQGSLAIAAGSALTVFAVRRATDGSANHGIVDTSDAAQFTNTNAMLLNDSASLTARVGGDNPATLADATTTRALVRAIYKTATRNVFRNGVAGLANNVADALVATDRYRVGALFQDVLPAHAMIHEVAIYARELTAAEITTVEGILTSRWQIT